MHTDVPALRHGASSISARCDIALLGVAVAAMLTLSLRHWGFTGVFPIFFCAVLASAWLSGFLAALFSTVLSILTVVVLSLPLFTVIGFGGYDSSHLALFIVISFATSSLALERSRSDSARRASEQHYRLLFDRNLAGVFLSTLNGKILDCNESFAKTLGYSSPGEVLSHPASDLYYDQATRESYIEQLKRDGSVFTYELCLKGKNNRPIWVIENVNLIEDDDGDLSLIQGTIIDISGRKLVEAALLETEQKYHDIFEHAVEGIFRTTPDGSFTAANPALAGMLGYDSPEDLIQNRGDLARQMYVDPRRREEFKQLVDEQGIVRDFEFQVRRKDGSKIWLSEHVRAVRDDNGAVLYYEGTAEDVTARKLTEEALRDSEERYRELFENAYEAVYVHDLDGNYISVNRAAEQLSGYHRSEIIGRNHAEFVAPKHLKETRERIREKLQGKEKTAYEIEIIAKDGHRVPVQITSRLIYENGIAVGVQGMARDISDRKRAEEALRSFPRRLIGAQEAERRRVARELHDEIGQALTAIRMNLQSVQHSANDESLAPQLDGSLNIIDRALLQVRELALDLRPSLLDDLGLVASLRWYLDREATRAGLALDLSIDLHGTRLAPEIETTCFRIAQEGLTNIVRHAKAEHVCVELSLLAADLRLLIRDDGIGFDVGEAQNRFAANLSLGLQGMKERALAVGGTIEIQSSKGSGTEVRAQIPFLPNLSSLEES